jgi:TPR repeat protein
MLDDKVNVDADKINEAKNNDGDAFQFIGFIYETEIKDYSKAMEWYQLAINQNNKDAYNDIGCLYYDGLGVSRDYDMSLGYLLKAVGHGDDSAMDNIGFYFLYGHGVPVDKYKALEWYIKYGKKPEQIKALNDKGVHLKEVDKGKLINSQHVCKN